MNIAIAYWKRLFVLVTCFLALGFGSLSQPTPAAAASVPVGVSDSVVRLYFAVFDREPDAAGRDYWAHLYFDGMPLPAIAREFMSSEEWSNTYGTVDDGAFVELLYNNVLDRSPDEAGRVYWTATLAGGVDRTSILLGFSESDEFVAATHTATPESPPQRFPLPPSHEGAGQRIVFSRTQQRVWLIEANGRVYDSYLVSGRFGVPGLGSYRVYSKSLTAWAGHDGVYMKHMVRFRPPTGSLLAIGFHSIPRDRFGNPLQSEAELGTYQSAGCVRQSDAKAAALYDWAPIGTLVVVVN